MVQGERMKAVKKTRGALKTLPTGRFTADRRELLEMENAALTEYYAEWITKMTGELVSSENFCEDLSNGVALLKLVSRIEGSGVKDIHDVKTTPKHTQIFKGRDNMVMFQDACRRLGLVDVVTTAELLEGVSTHVISALVQLEEIYDEDGIPPVLEEPQEEPEDQEEKRRSSRRSSKRRSSRRAQVESNPLQELLNKIKALCGCNKDTVAE